MAGHSAEVVETKLLANGVVAVLFRCCEDPSTNEWHTLYDVANKTESELEAWEKSCKEHAEKHHGNAQAALQFFEKRKKAK